MKKHWFYGLVCISICMLLGACKDYDESSATDDPAILGKWMLLEYAYSVSEESRYPTYQTIYDFQSDGKIIVSYPNKEYEPYETSYSISNGRLEMPMMRHSCFYNYTIKNGKLSTTLVETISFDWCGTGIIERHLFEKVK